MKTTIKINHTLKQTFHYSKNIENQIQFLSMDQKKINELLKEIATNNPFLEYIPSKEINEYIEQTIETKDSLQDHLYYQLHTSNHPYHKKICEYIIESLDKTGFFSEDINQSCTYLKVNKQQFIENLEFLQSFDPIGVCATNHTHSLIIQLNHKNYIKAATLLKEHNKDIEIGNIEHILHAMQITKEEFQQLLAQIRTCNPFPCSQYTSEPTILIIPEFEIIKENNELVIEPRTIGKLSIHENQTKTMSKEAKQYFKEAKFYVDTINKRNKTLLILANELINIQKDHFLYQNECNACTLKDIANATGYAISTVSRVLSNKYYQFEDQIYPIKDLFVSKTQSGTSRSTIQNEIKQIIDTEDKTRPYSDEKIVQILSKKDIIVSRRTIAKYRLALNIPSTNQRKEKQYH